MGKLNNETIPMEYVIDLPDAVDPNEVPVSFTLMHMVAMSAEKMNLKNKTVSLTTQLNEAVAALAAKQELIDSGNRTIDGQQKTIDNQAIQLQEALAHIKQLEAATTPKPPPIVPPVVTPPPVVNKSRTPVITKTTLKNVVMSIIVKDDTPSPTQDEMTRANIRISADAGCNTWRGFLSPEEVKQHLSRVGDSNLPDYGRLHGLEYIADTVDTPAQKLSAAELKAYFDGLKALGARAVVVNDADDTQKKPEPLLLDIVQKIRAATDLPLIASCSANVAIDTFRKRFDFIEVQCFWSNITELKKFLLMPVDMWCLPTQDSMTVEKLTAQQTAVLAHVPMNISFYAAHDYDGTDFRNMPAQVAVVKSMNAKWWTARHGLVTA